jgi:cobalt-zinc-cadmium efflux system outer membrane protein
MRKFATLLKCVTSAALLLGSVAAQTHTLSIHEAIDLALANSPALKAARTQIDQSRAQETTAALRPNPVLQGDAQFLPIFSPNNFSADNFNQDQQYDIGMGYLFERGGKRQKRLQAARDQTEVTRSGVRDAERNLAFSVAQQFTAALLAKANLDFAIQNLESFRKTVEISETRQQAGDISQGDLLRIKVQLLQFETDVSGARVGLQQARVTLRQLIGFDSVAADYQLVGELTYQPLTETLEQAQATALQKRPDLAAARQSLTAARSQTALAQANAKPDPTTSVTYSHTAGTSSASFFFNIPLPVFNRNQGEIARSRFAESQAMFDAKAAEEAVLSDVQSVYEQAKAAGSIVDLYASGYLKQAQDSREITGFAFRQGAASLIDLLDAERTFRNTELSYRQALANYQSALQQLQQAEGSTR